MTRTSRICGWISRSRWRGVSVLASCLTRFALAFTLCAITVIAAPAQTFTTLHMFLGYPDDGSNPNAGLVQGADGNFYGTTANGGSSFACFGPSGCGTVFKITPTGSVTILHSFDSTDGYNVFAGLAQSTGGDFYGTTATGGTNGDGTIFKITTSGTLNTLYSFGAPYGGGSNGLVQANDGNFYGTTGQGGAYSKGTVFKITPAGALTTLYSFCSESGCSDGAYPACVLIQGTDGNLYGTTSSGGAGGAQGDTGTIFKITLSGTLTTLYRFCPQPNCTDGSGPEAGLIQATDGNFYGTTTAGGTYNYGTVFRLNSSGKLTALHSFDGTDGNMPDASLIQASDGNFYGTTTYGGGTPLNLSGSIFTITPTGALTVLHYFDGSDGYWPYDPLVQGTNGTLYGTVSEGDGQGTVFSISLGLRPFVETEPGYGTAGSSIKILGTKLTGATSVTFNGTPATFTIESPTAIKTTVPIGATTGPVQVMIPKGTLTSNVNFRVLP